jgi:hypothetical protein
MNKMQNISKNQIEFLTKLKEERGNIDSILLSLTKWSLVEYTEHYGNYEGSDFNLEVDTNWKWVRLGYDVDDLDSLIQTLENLPLGEIGSMDLTQHFICEDMSDGDTEIIASDFTPELSEELAEEIDLYELYWDSEINNSEYHFDKGSIFQIEITLKEGEPIIFEEGLG